MADHTKQGLTIVTGAAGAAKADLGMRPYAASKPAVKKLTETLSKEIRPSGGWANAILPSIINTPANHDGMPGSDTLDWIPPGDIAHLVGFLLSDSAHRINGALIPITCGA
ncbi:SDR family oxidoreductase [Hyphomonas johnsonii]|nr:SDR family oxidoreductase [Hyphomonas johnsonii]